MNVNIKYYLGSKVWTMQDCEIVCGEVVGIQIFPNGTFYSLECRLGTFSVHEDKCFATKLELLEHIKS